MFMHTAVDDSILDPMRFVSKVDDYQVYGALLLEVMTNQKMRDSPAYKCYLAFATGTASPKKERKYKKPASPSRKRTPSQIFFINRDTSLVSKLYLFTKFYSNILT
ncbi:hypothetical protein Tco_0586628 [Tanacetum coccineum]